MDFSAISHDPLMKLAVTSRHVPATTLLYIGEVHDVDGHLLGIEIEGDGEEK